MKEHRNMIPPDTFFGTIGRVFFVVVLCWLAVNTIIGLLTWLSD